MRTRLGHSPYSQRGMQCLQHSMRVNSSSGQGSAACNSSPPLCWLLHSSSHEFADPGGVTEGEFCQHSGVVENLIEGCPSERKGFEGDVVPYFLCGECGCVCVGIEQCAPCRG